MSETVKRAGKSVQEMRRVMRTAALLYSRREWHTTIVSSDLILYLLQLHRETLNSMNTGEEGQRSLYAGRYEHSAKIEVW